MRTHRTIRYCSLMLALLLSAPALAARNPKPDQSLFDPATDTGRYMSVHDAETFLRGRWSAGLFFNYANKPLELRNVTTAQNFDIVRHSLGGIAAGGYGITDWFSIGASVPVTFWQVFFDPNTQRLTGGLAPKQQKAGLGDIRLETKFRLLDIDRYNFGIAVIPHFIFPTGRKGSFISGERWTPGATVALEGNIKDRLWLGLNVGYQYHRDSDQYFTGNANALIDDILKIGVGARVRVTDEWAFIGEGLTETRAKSPYRVATQSPMELLGGVQFTPQKALALRGLALTLMGGGGITRGVGAPKAEVIFGVSYPTPKVVTIKDVPVEVVEKIVITQKIHYAFDSAQIRAISYPILDDVASLLRENSQIMHVRIEGHTDSVGSAAYNQSLSRRRADSVVTYLVKKGVDRNRLSAVGYGESQPIADNRSAEGRAMNRRTEFTIME